MKKGYGRKGLKLIECVNPYPKYNRWHVRWNVQPVLDEEGNETNQVSFKYKLIEHHTPTLSEIKEIVISDMNEDIDNKIIKGFVWNDIPVWLSQENQFNYKSAYDLAVQTNGANLPIVFKFGTIEEPIYYQFTDMETFTDFYMKSVMHISVVLEEGWKLKDNIDWLPYEQILNRYGTN